MNNYNRIKETKIEDFIFIVYYIIITLSLYANKIEREFLINNDNNKKEEYRNIMFIIFGIAFLVYLYYFITNLKDINNNEDDLNNDLNILSLIASFLVLISGIIYLYIIYKDNDISVELAFN